MKTEEEKSMRIVLMQLVLPIVTYFIGVYVGKKSEAVRFEDALIQHVGYTEEQMGYDK